MKAFTTLYPLVLFLLTLATINISSKAQEITVCDEEGNTTCTEAGNRICLFNTTDSTDTCGNCAFNYIEYKEECRFIDDIDFQLVIDLIDEYAPQFSSNASDEVRIQRLTLLCKVISYFASQIPPLKFDLGLNKYSLDTEEERSQLLGTTAGFASVNMSRYDLDAARRQRNLQEGLPTDYQAPPQVDWEAANAMTYVKDQGRCGCCWAVSTMAAVESAAYLTNSSGFLQSLSFQQLISCDERDNGCNGGNIINAMDYAWRNGDFEVPGEIGGIATLNDYPYTDGDGEGAEQCLASTTEATIFLKEPKIVVNVNDDFSREEREDRLKVAVSIQPIPVVMTAGCPEFSSYRGGVMTTDGDCACQLTSCVDHAVVLVGYDDTADPQYWKLRNSWGESWGENGYFRIAQEGGGRWGLFAILAEATIPLQAYNTSAADPDAVDDDLETWAVSLIVIAGVIILLVCCATTFKVFCS